MYSLPIGNYTDFWRVAKNQSLYIGSGLLLVGSTLVYLPAEKVMDSFPQRTVPQIQPLKPQLKENVDKSMSLIIPIPEEVVPIQSSQVLSEFRIEDVEVPAVTEYVESNQMAPGMSKVKEDGAKGIERRVIKTTRVNGEINSEQITHQFTLDAPKKRVVFRNSQTGVAEKTGVKSAFDVSKLNVQKVISMEATAYTYTGNRTATGVEPREGLIAVDPRVIPLGSQVYIEGYGYAIAADTGGLIKGNIIDVFFPSLQRCLNWGRKSVKVYVLNGK